MQGVEPAPTGGLLGHLIGGHDGAVQTHRPSLHWQCIAEERVPSQTSAQLVRESQPGRAGQTASGTMTLPGGITPAPASLPESGPPDDSPATAPHAATEAPSVAPRATAIQNDEHAVCGRCIAFV